MLSVTNLFRFVFVTICTSCISPAQKIGAACGVNGHVVVASSYALLWPSLRRHVDCPAATREMYDPQSYLPWSDVDGLTDLLLLSRL